MSTGRERTVPQTGNRPGLTDLLLCVTHKTRRELLRSLAESSKDVSTLAEELDFELDKISHHLRPLRECGLVEFKAFKKKRIYRLSDRVTTSICGGMLHLTVASANEDEHRVAIQTRIAPSSRSAETARSPITRQSPREPSSG